MAWPGRQRRAWGTSPADGAAPSLDAMQAGLELATQGIILLDSSATIVAVNSLARALIQSRDTGLPGLEFWEVVPETVAEDHRSASEQALRDGSTHAFVVHHAFEDQWIEYSLRRHPCGAVVNMRDVTDTRQALLLLQNSEFCNQTLFDVNPLAMWLFDADSQLVLAANQAAAALYGLDQNQLAARSVEALFPDGEGAALISSLPSGDFRREMRLCTQKKAGGERMLVELACASLQWLARPAVLVSVVDVGARHLADAHLRRLNAELEQRIEQSTGRLQGSQDELAAFTYAMSHDLKAPLHVVNGFAKALGERYSAVLGEQGRHYLARIQVSTRQLAKLIDDLRTLTYLPRLAMAPELVDLAPVCRHLIDELCKREPGRQLALEMESTLLLRCDKTLLVAALACLIDNAWKFTSKKEQGWIKVGLMPGKTPNDAVLSVSDNGAGFDPAYAGKLFTPFQRLHSSADFPGGGLGLAIVKRVAERHGGAVWATTTDQAGASFFMSLPQATGHTPPPLD